MLKRLLITVFKNTVQFYNCVKIWIGGNWRECVVDGLIKQLLKNLLITIFTSTYFNSFLPYVLFYWVKSWIDSGLRIKIKMAVIANNCGQPCWRTKWLLILFGHNSRWLKYITFLVILTAALRLGYRLRKQIARWYLKKLFLPHCLTIQKLNGLSCHWRRRFQIYWN